MKGQLYKLFKFLFGWPLSLIALYFVWTIIAPKTGDLINNLRHVNIIILLIGIACLLVYYLIRSFIWYKLLRDRGYTIIFKQTAFLWGISEIKRYIPGKFWFILGRASAFSMHDVKKKDTAALMLIELELFAIGACIVSLLSLPFLQRYFLNGIPDVQFWLFLIYLAVICLTLFYIFHQKLTRRLPIKIQTVLGAVLPHNSPALLSFLLLLSSIDLLFFGLGNYFVISSFLYLHPQLIPQIVGFFTASFLLGFLSFFTPAGLGIREGIVTVGLAKIMSFSAAAFGSLFTRLFLIISELIFLIISFIWSKIHFKKITAAEKWIASHPQLALLVCLFFIYVLYFTVTSFLRYDNFYTGRFDLGNMAQTVWNTSQGRIFVFTNPNGTETVSRLAFHADFLLVLLAPFYFIWSDPKMLLLIQTVIVGAGAFFVYLIAKDILKNKNYAFIFSFIYLINPSIQRANLYDFHSVTLVTFFLLGTYYFYRKKQYFWFSIFALLAALTKEEIWVIIGLFGVFLFIFQKKKLLGSIIFLISIAMFYFLIWHAIPASLGSGHFALAYYSDFGDSPGKIIKNTIFSPMKIFNILLDPGRLSYLNQLFLPVGYMSLFAPVFLIFALPDLMINLLSNNIQLHQIYYQYTSPITPFLFITAILGVAGLKKIKYIPSAVLIIYMVSVSLMAAYFFGPLPGSKESNLDMYTNQLKNKDRIENYLAHIPENISIAATNNAGSHLSQRQQIYTVPLGIGKADMVIFLLTNPSTIVSEKEIVRQMRVNKDYTKILEEDTFIVFRKQDHYNK